MYESEYVLEYCNGYVDNCDDIPSCVFAGFADEPLPCDCPNGDGCFHNYSGTFASYVRPIGEKVAISGELRNLAKGIRISKSVPSYFVKDGEPVYFRLLQLVNSDAASPDKMRSFTVGLEMKSPMTGTVGLKEIKDFKPTKCSYLYSTVRGNQIISLIRAKGVAADSDEMQPTPAKDTGAPKIASVLSRQMHGPNAPPIGSVSVGPAPAK
jgi:hypothetical protein